MDQPSYPMNTASVLLEDKQRFTDALHSLMMSDGRDPWSARTDPDTVEAYAAAIFGKAGPTARTRVRDALYRMDRANRH
ncbi:MAG: hypothetical protein FJ189_00460 [Gammaproteobacteria bacterium]|nr:hypothetical protein [Gammaproteobacteria bacterium]